MFKLLPVVNRLLPRLRQAFERLATNHRIAPGVLVQYLSAGSSAGSDMRLLPPVKTITDRFIAQLNGSSRAGLAEESFVPPTSPMWASNRAGPFNSSGSASTNNIRREIDFLKMFAAYGREY